MIPRCARALLSLALAGLLAACGGSAATNTPAAIATTAPASATTAGAPPSAASPAMSAAPRVATPATPATPAATLATPRATPATPTRAASPATAATPATPARPASPTAAGGGMVLTDADNQCQVTLPANFTPDPAGGGNAVSADERVGINVLAFPVDPFGFEGTIDFIIGTVSASVEGYQETDRQSGTSRGRPYTDVSFQGTSVGEPVAGRFYFVQEGANICALTVVMQAAAAGEYAATIDALAESLQAVTP
jgi:hypothetical protein